MVAISTKQMVTGQQKYDFIIAEGVGIEQEWACLCFCVSVIALLFSSCFSVCTKQNKKLQFLDVQGKNVFKKKSQCCCLCFLCPAILPGFLFSALAHSSPPFLPS